MKKISFLFFAVLLTGITLLTSCKKDATVPTISFVAQNGYITGDATVPQGSKISFGVDAKSGGSSNLSHFKITRTIGGSSDVVYETPIDSIAFKRAFDAEVSTAVGTETWTFTITDKDNLSADISFVITTVSSPIQEYTQVMLGSYDNATLGSSFASADGTVYKLADAKVNAAKIDWLYFWGAANSATIAAPDDASAISVFNSLTNGLNTWSVRNSTRFRVVTEGATWANITNAGDIANIAVNTATTNSNMLNVGDIVAFKTVSGKLGLIKIDAIATGASGTITYTVKVQQ